MAPAPLSTETSKRRYPEMTTTSATSGGVPTSGTLYQPMQQTPPSYAGLVPSTSYPNSTYPVQPAITDYPLSSHHSSQFGSSQPPPPAQLLAYGPGYGPTPISAPPSSSPHNYPYARNEDRPSHTIAMQQPPPPSYEDVVKARTQSSLPQHMPGTGIGSSGMPAQPGGGPNVAPHMTTSAPSSSASSYSSYSTPFGASSSLSSYSSYSPPYGASSSLSSPSSSSSVVAASRFPVLPYTAGGGVNQSHNYSHSSHSPSSSQGVESSTAMPPIPKAFLQLRTMSEARLRVLLTDTIAFNVSDLILRCTCLEFDFM